MKITLILVFFCIAFAVVLVAERKSSQRVAALKSRLADMPGGDDPAVVADEFSKEDLNILYRNYARRLYRLQEQPRHSLENEVEGESLDDKMQVLKEAMRIKMGVFDH